MEVPENRNGVGSSPWPQFPFASSKNTKIFHRQANVASSRGRQVEPGTHPPLQTELCVLQCLNISVLREQSHSCSPRVAQKLKELMPSKTLAEAWPTSGCLIQRLRYCHELESRASS